MAHHFEIPKMFQTPGGRSFPVSEGGSVWFCDGCWTCWPLERGAPDVCPRCGLEQWKGDKKAPTEPTEAQKAMRPKETPPRSG